MFSDGRHIKIRALDMDDLLILSLLHEGFNSRRISKFLLLTPSAISQRCRKYRELFDITIFKPTGAFNCNELTQEAKTLAIKAREAYLLMLGVDNRFVIGSLFRQINNPTILTNK